VNFYISFDGNNLVAFIFSQVFTLFSYVAIAISYMVKKRQHVLMLSVINVIFFAVAMMLLQAWSALGAVGVALIRNIAFLINDSIRVKKYADSGKIAPNEKRITKFDTIVFVFVILATIAITLILNFTSDYMSDLDWIFSFLPALATIAYTISVYQNNIKIYRILAIPTSLLWLIYLIYVASPVGILLESVLLGVALTSIGFYSMFEREQKKIKEQTLNANE